MRFFFRSRQFKIILSVLIALITISVIFSIIGSQLSPQANIMGAFTAPFRSAVNGIWNGLNDFVSAYRDGSKVMLENAELEAELNDLREQLADYQQTQAENEFYKKYLKIAEEHPEFVVAKVDVDKNPELAGEFSVMSIPTLVVIKDKKVVNQSAGARPKAQILAMLEG